MIMLKQVAKVCIAAIFITTIASCERRNCNNVVCPANQECFNGSCLCESGREGPNCDQLAYEKYLTINTFTNENCNPVTPFSTSNVFIQHGTSAIDRIEIYNLMGGYCTYVTAYISTDNNNEGNILTIPEQSINCSGSNSVSGQGTYDKVNHRVNLQLYYSFAGISYQCNTILQ